MLTCDETIKQIEELNFIKVNGIYGYWQPFSYQISTVGVYESIMFYASSDTDNNWKFCWQNGIFYYWNEEWTETDIPDVATLITLYKDL